jgi:hypothetical protein
MAGVEEGRAARSDGAEGGKSAGIIGAAPLVSGSKGAAKSDRCRPYRAERSPDWIKVKNPKHASIERVKEAFS